MYFIQFCDRNPVDTICCTEGIIDNFTSSFSSPIIFRTKSVDFFNPNLCLHMCVLFHQCGRGCLCRKQLLKPYLTNAIAWNESNISFEKSVKSMKQSIQSNTGRAPCLLVSLVAEKKWTQSSCMRHRSLALPPPSPLSLVAHEDLCQFISVFSGWMGLLCVEWAKISGTLAAKEFILHAVAVCERDENLFAGKTNVNVIRLQEA